MATRVLIEVMGGNVQAVYVSNAELRGAATEQK
jgi:hypothetical protein